MKQLMLIAFPAFALAGYSQVKVVDVDKDNVQINSSMFYTVAGSPVSTAKYVRLVEGSPYFNDEWMSGKLVLGDGRMYDSLRLKLDLSDHLLLYISKEGTELVATTPVKGVTLIDSVTGKQYHFIHSSFLLLPPNMQQGWYQFLAAGKTTIYKLIIKNMTESKPYGSATTEQRISTTGQYFIYHHSTFTRVKKIKEIPDLLRDKKNELRDYISSRKLSGKSDMDYAELVAYYNKLVE